MDWRTLIPATVLVAAEPFEDWDLSGAAVAALLGAGLGHVSAPLRLTVDLCPLEAGIPENFDERMLSARAVVLAVPSIDPAAMRAARAFEIATRARQSGVPAYAVMAQPLDLFDARILDLQHIEPASDAGALERAGQRLAGLL